MNNTESPSSTIRTSTNVIELHNSFVRKQSISVVENERIWIEAAILKTLDDSGISPKLMRQGELDGKAYIDIERIKGDTLSECDFKSIKDRKKAAFFTILSLSMLHDLDVIHGDFKPANVIIDEDGNARIIDFGNSNTVGSEVKSDSQFIYSTPTIIPPEILDKKSEWDQRSDVFSLGVTLYFIFTGKYPFSGNSGVEIANSICIDQPKPFDFDEWVVVKNCLQKDSEIRYQHAGEVLKDFSKIQHGTSVLDRTPSVFQSLASTVKEITTENWKSLAIMLLAFTALGGAVFQTLKSFIPPTNEQIASGYALEGVTPVRLTKDDSSESALIGPSGKRIFLNSGKTTLVKPGNYVIETKRGSSVRYGVRVIPPLGKLPIRGEGNRSFLRTFPRAGVYQNGVIQFLTIRPLPPVSMKTVELPHDGKWPSGIICDMLEECESERLPTISELRKMGFDSQDYLTIDNPNIGIERKVLLVQRTGEVPFSFDYQD